MDLQTIEIKNLIEFNQAMIRFDNSELIQKAIEETIRYKNLIVTEEELPNVKKNVINLNKLITNLEDQRKLVKKTYNEPYNEFENKIKEVVNILDQAKSSLKIQFDKFEELRIDKRKKEIDGMLDAKLSDRWLWDKFHTEFKIIPSSWLNATTFSIKQIKELINENYRVLCARQQQEIETENIRKENERLKKEAQEAEFKSVLSLIDVYNTAHDFNITLNDFKPFTKEALTVYFNKLVADKKMKLIVEKVDIPVPSTEEIVRVKSLTSEIFENKGLRFSVLIENLTLTERKSVKASLVKKLPHCSTRDIDNELS